MIPVRLHSHQSRFTKWPQDVWSKSISTNTILHKTWQVCDFNIQHAAFYDHDFEWYRHKIAREPILKIMNVQGRADRTSENNQNIQKCQLLTFRDLYTKMFWLETDTKCQEILRRILTYVAGSQRGKWATNTVDEPSVTDLIENAQNRRAIEMMQSRFLLTKDFENFCLKLVSEHW